ncbi:MAG TPA: DUF4214 domain-containing protein [Vicinamibacterales bacterium]|nr:DUF4214 domain-containing protein [Vicinamibacterales bacterium]
MNGRESHNSNCHGGNMKSTRPHRLAAALAAAAFCTPSFAANLFEYVSAAKDAKLSELLYAPTAIHVEAAAIAALGEGGVMDARLPDGRDVKVRIDRIEIHSNGDVSWSGKVLDSARDLDAIGTSGATGTYASLETPEATWGIVPSQTGHDWIFDKTMSELTRVEPPSVDDFRIAPPDYSSAHAKGTCPAVSSMPASRATIDVLAVITPDFVSRQGGAAGAETRLNYLFNTINTYMANSNVAIAYRRVATINVAYQAATTINDDDGAALDALGGGQGNFANVPALRSFYGADMVAMFRGPKNSGGTSISGIAWVNGDRNGNISANSAMYSVIGDWTFPDAMVAAHELGHNLGNQHDRPNANTTAGGSTPYSYGHYVCGANAPTCGQAGINSAGTGFGTIMSYQRPTVPKFASPSLTCQNSGGIAAPCGVADQQDDVRAMNCVRTQVAALRTGGLANCSNLSTDTDRDGIPDCLESASGKVNGVRDNDIFSSSLLFAAQQYRDFLAREGDADGLNYWATSLGNGSNTRAQMIQGFLDSAEFQGLIAPVARLYFAYFLRIPDYAGLQYWIGQFKSGVSLGTISQNFAASPEFQNRYGALNNTQFVTLIYQNVMGRAPDANGLAYWAGQLASGVTRGSVMLSFSESPEYKAVIDSEVYVTMTYAGMLRRAPDQGGFDFWANQLDATKSASGLIGGFVASPEYRARFL